MNWHDLLYHPEIGFRSLPIWLQALITIGLCAVIWFLLGKYDHVTRKAEGKE
jgi:hypothetical protein